MSRRPTTIKHLVELYLVIVGGAYTLAALVALIANVVSAEKNNELREVRGDLRENGTMLIVAALILAAGIGIKTYRRWGLLLAGAMGVVIVAYAITQMRIDPWEYHTFTIGMPMAAILLWVMLPPVWREFGQRGDTAP